MQNMRIAFFLYEGLTTLDIIGPHDVLSRLPEAEAISVGATTGPFMADTGVLGLTATHTIDQVDAADILVVPGGVDGTFAAAADEKAAVLPAGAVILIAPAGTGAAAAAAEAAPMRASSVKRASGSCSPSSSLDCGGAKSFFSSCFKTCLINFIFKHPISCKFSRLNVLSLIHI